MPAYSANIDSQIKAQQKSQSDMKKKIQQYNAIAKEKSKQSKNLLTQLSRLKQNANESQAQMNTLEQENTRLQNSVRELNRSIARVNESMRIIIATLKNRLVDMYKFTPQENSLSLILNSQGPHEAVNTAYMLRKFAVQDQYMLEELTRKEHELTEARNRLEENKSRIAQQTDELKKKREEFDSTIKKTDTLLKNVQSEQKKAEAAAKELENAQRAVGNKINSLMKQKKTAQTNKASSSKITNTSSKSGSKTVAKTTQSASSKAASTGSVKSLSWPLNGTVTMQYGSIQLRNRHQGRFRYSGQSSRPRRSVVSGLVTRLRSGCDYRSRRRSLNGICAFRRHISERGSSCESRNSDRQSWEHWNGFGIRITF